MRSSSSLDKGSCTAMNGEAHGRRSEGQVSIAIEPTPTRGKAIVHVFVVGTLNLTMLMGTAAVSVAAPPEYNTVHCKCSCEASNGSAKELTRAMTGSCMSNGKACTFTVDGGKTFTPGKLSNCQKCLPHYPLPSCTSAAINVLPGSLQQLQPQTPTPGRMPAPAGTIQRRGVEGEQPISSEKETK